jgi:hypothetical protein
MHPESLKVTFAIESTSVKDALSFFSKRFLRATLIGCDIVRQPTQFCLADLCDRLIDGWKGGRIAYESGTITLVFRSGLLESQPDILIYEPQTGDRLVFSPRPKPALAPASQPPIPPISLNSAQRSLSDLHQSASNQKEDSSTAQQLTQALITANESVARLTAAQQTLEKTIQSLIVEQTKLKRQIDQQAETYQAALQEAIAHYHQEFPQQLQRALANQADMFVNLLHHHLGENSEPLSQQIKTLRYQLEYLTKQLSEFEPVHEAAVASPPQSDDEWRTRIKDTWGTVGDYEKFSFTHREDNAETPIYFTPDWIALCELDWAQRLNSTLADLYELLYGVDGIGYAGADILQQFGRHVDELTGDGYYIYHQNGFNAHEALWQIANDPHHSWLLELQRLWHALSDYNHHIFQMFGWEKEAIVALETIVNVSHGDRSQSTHHSTQSQHGSGHSPKYNTLGDYLSVLKMGPFTPITIESIKMAYKQAMKAAHPDRGGSNEQAQMVNEAYQAILKYYFPEAT